MRNISFFFSLALILTSSCNAFLDVKSDKSLVVANSLEDALYLLDDYQRMNELRVPSWGESVSDDYYLSDASFNLTSEDLKQFYLWNYQEYFGRNNDWGNGYIPIYNANLALDILSGIERTATNAATFDLTKGSALFFRSYYFYSLLVVFAQAYDVKTADQDLGIVLRLTSDFNVKSIRSSVKDCFDQIERDLKSSIDLLPNHPTFVTRPSKSAAYAILARLYLYKRDYQQALKYADLALNIKSDLMDYNGDEDILMSGSTTASPFKQFNKETIFYAESNPYGAIYTSGGSRPGIVNRDLYKNYGSSDLRRDLFFRMSGDDAIFRGHYTNSTILFGGLSVNELYLIKSECLAINQQPIEAIKVLDVLLENRYSIYEPTDPNSLSNQRLIEYIRNERRKELICRGLRFSDIKRYNKEGAKITLSRVIGGKTYFLEPNSKKYALHLPSDIIAITGIQQN